MDLPVDLLTLKRPALQKLCKKHGIRANGKNTEMIAALEAVRNGNSSDIKKDIVPDSTSGETKMAEDTSSAVREGEVRKEEEEESVGTPTSPELGMASQKSEVDSKSRKSYETENISRSEGRTNLVEDDLSSSGIRQSSRKRQRNSSLAAVVAENGDVKKARLCDSRSEVAESSPAARLDGSMKYEEQQEYFEDHKKRLFLEADTLCDEVTGPAVVAEVSKTPEQTGHFGVAQTPISPPSSSAPSSQRKRKRKSTFSKDGNEDRGDSPQQKKQRRSTYDVLPADSFIQGQGGLNGYSDGPCDSTDAGVQSDMVAMMSEQSTLRLLEDGQSENDRSIKEDMMSLLEKRVTERMADPNYVPVSNGMELQDCSKSEVKKKFDRAHQVSFNKMKSIASCYQEGLARQKSLGEGKRPITPSVASVKKERRVSLTSKARAKLKSVTPSKPSNITSSSVKRPWQKKGNVGVFKPGATTTATASYNFSGNKSVKFEGGLKDQNSSGSGMKRKPSTPGNIKKSVSVVKKFTASKNTTDENSLVQSASKRRQTFDLKASLKKNLNYKPHTGKLPPVSITKF